MGWSISKKIAAVAAGLVLVTASVVASPPLAVADEEEGNQYLALTVDALGDKAGTRKVTVRATCNSPLDEYGNADTCSISDGKVEYKTKAGWVSDYWQSGVYFYLKSGQSGEKTVSIPALAASTKIRVVFPEETYQRAVTLRTTAKVAAKGKKTKLSVSIPSRILAMQIKTLKAKVDSRAKGKVVFSFVNAKKQVVLSKTGKVKKGTAKVKVTGGLLQAKYKVWATFVPSNSKFKPAESKLVKIRA
jgi:hypothetical protein